MTAAARQREAPARAPAGRASTGGESSAQRPPARRRFVPAARRVAALALTLVTATACAHGRGRAQQGVELGFAFDDADADADVYVDGHYVGTLGEVQGTRAGSLRLQPGAHRVEVRKPGRFPVQRTVRVDARDGAPVRVDVELLHEPP